VAASAVQLEGGPLAEAALGAARLELRMRQLRHTLDQLAEALARLAVEAEAFAEPGR